MVDKNSSRANYIGNNDPWYGPNLKAIENSHYVKHGQNRGGDQSKPYYTSMGGMLSNDSVIANDNSFHMNNANRNYQILSSSNGNLNLFASGGMYNTSAMDIPFQNEKFGMIDLFSLLFRTSKLKVYDFEEC